MQQRILLIQLRQLGDILLTTPCIREIKRQNPNATITFLAHAMGALILEGNPHLDEIYYYRESDSWAQQLKLLKFLRQRKFDIVIDFMANPRSALYARATGSPRRIAFRTRRNFLFNETMLRPSGDQYIVRDKFQLLRHAGFSPENENLVLPWSEKHLGPLSRFLNENSAVAQARLRIILSPTHRREARRWPLENYAHLAEALVRTCDAEVVWVYGPGEDMIAQKCEQLTREKTYLAPATSFREMAAFMANFDAFIGNSNGLSHVAVATQIPSLQLHGPTLASAWCPMTTMHQAIQAPGNGRGNSDLTKLMHEVVLEKVRAMLPMLREFAAKRKERPLRVRSSEG